MWVNMIKLQIKAENKANGVDEDGDNLNNDPDLGKKTLKSGGKEYRESC